MPRVMRFRRLLVFCLLILAGTGRRALAQDFAAAGQHFSSAQDAFQQGQFAQAAKEYQAAYDITKDPALLFNIGEAWQRAGQADKALSAYRAYLADPAAGTPSDRQEAEKRVAALSAALAPVGDAQSATAAAAATEKQNPTPESKSVPAQEKNPAAGKASTSPSPTRRLRTAAWVSIAAAVALATAGAIMGLGAQNRADEIQRRTTILTNGQPPIYDDNQRDAYETLMSEGNAYNSAAIALLSLAGAATVTGAALFIAEWVKRPKSDKSRLSAAPLPALAIGGGTAVLSIGGSF